jgi:glycosyltransferase involved in cell wall biosynthesis
LKLALLFNFNPIWTGGIIYLQNIVRILNFLNEKDKPELLIFYPKELGEYLFEIDYPKKQLIEWEFPELKKGFVVSIFNGKNLFTDEIIKKYQPDIIFPQKNFPIKNQSRTAELCWIADLQHKYYPNFFSKKKLLERRLRLFFTLRNSNSIVISSQAVKDDFYKFFKIPKHIRFHIYHFVSIIDRLPNIKLEELLEKYQLPEKYFMVSNQFHKHKNHKVVFEAIANLKKQGVKLHLAVTGRLPSDPDSKYLKTLNDIIKENNLNENISLLGLIPREEQLMLMKYSQAIIQPSLFEGWSTVIEDARSLQVPVIASNLNVNIEQLQEKGHYFSPYNAEELSAIIASFPNRDFSENIYESYERNLKNAAYELLSIFEKTKKDHLSKYFHVDK